MKKQKITKYNKDNILGWSEEDFRDVICNMCNVRFITGEPLTPLMNCYYMQESDEWKREKLGLTKEYFKQQEINKLEQQLKDINEE